MFRTSTPVTAAGFFDRKTELKRLEASIAQLRKGSPRWVAMLGVRKVGKTSLLLELMRRNQHPDVRFVVLDCFEETPLGPDIFRRLALRTVDAFFASEAAVSLEALAATPDDYRAALLDAPSFRKLDRTLRADVLSLCARAPDKRLAELALGLGERLAVATRQYCVIAWDEFQELAKLPGTRGTGALSLARAVWQRHQRTTYIVCGSERSLLERLVSHETSPFFQHFDVMELGPMSADDGVAMLTASAPRGRAIPAQVAREAVRVLGGHPFYLQLFGEALTAREPPYDVGLVREIFSELLFNRTGRLSLYFMNEFERVVGKASTLAAVLEALADGPRRTMEVAQRTGASSGAAVRYLERLGDAVVRRDEAWQLVDPVFELWLRWRKPGGTVVPMAVLGDDAEREVARRLAEMGFELVYQSRASRGAFDLLGVRSGVQLGIQVKRTALPLRFAKTAWVRLLADAKRLGWRFVIAVVTPSPGTQVLFLDPGKAKVGRAVTLDARCTLDNLLAWLDG